MELCDIPATADAPVARVDQYRCFMTIMDGIMVHYHHRPNAATQAEHVLGLHTCDIIADVV